MESIIKFLNSMDGNYIIIFLIALFYSIERLLGTPFKFDRRINHFLHNLVMMIIFYFANLAFAVLQVGIIKWSSAHQIGLFYWVELPIWLKVIVGVMCLDFASYCFHRLAHTLPLFWRAHRVHHSDSTMDSSTFFRGHPLELLIFGTASTLACLVFGIDLPILGVYFIVVLPFQVAQHANIQLPDWTDKIFGKVFITPNMHKVHHDQNQYYTDSNFADVFVFWDKLFGTYKYSPVSSRIYGLKEFESTKKQTFWYLMISPFINIKRSTNTSDKP